MKKTIIKSICALSVVLSVASCQDYNEQFDGYVADPKVEDIQTVEVTLTEADYKYIASSSTNQAIAAEQNMTDGLNTIGSTLAFNNENEVELFMPRLLEQKYGSYLTNGSAVTVTYKNVADVELPSYPITEYKLTPEDYVAAYGGDAEAALGYFTPSVSADKKLPAILKSAFAEAEGGDYAVVTFKQSDVDPVSDGDDESTSAALVLEGEPFGLPSVSPYGTLTVSDIQFSYDGVYYNSYGSYALNKESGATLSNKTAMPNLTEIIATDDYAHFNLTLYVGATSDNITTKVEYTQADGSNDRVFTIPAGNEFFKFVNEATYNAQADKITFKYDGKEIVFEGNAEGFPDVYRVGSIKVGDVDFNFSSCYYSSYGSYTVPANSDGYFGNATELVDLKSVVLTEDYQYYNVTLYAGTSAGEKATKIEYTKEGNDYIYNIPAGYGYFTIVNESTHNAQADKITINYGSVASSTMAKAAPSTYEHYAVYLYNGSEWVVPASTTILSAADYVAMGSKYGNLSNTQKPDEVLPIYLAKKYPYSVDGDKIDVFYNYYDGSAAYTCGRYININGTWANIAVTGTTVNQALFNLIDSKWVMNKKVYITLTSNTGMGDYADKSEDIKTFEVDGATFEYKWAFYSADKASIALPKGDSYIRNLTAFNGLTEIVIVEDYRYYNIKLGTSATADGEYTEVNYVKDGNNYIYTIAEGQSFVKIYNEAEYQAYADAITFEFASLE